MNCFLCLNNTWQPLNEDYVKCDCGMIKVKEMPNADLYLFENYCAYQTKNGYLPYYLRFDTDYDIAKARLNHLVTYIQSGKLIDIGAGGGAFVKCANDNGFNAVGYEVDWLSALVSSRISKSYISSSIECENYDIVTMFDVIEHQLNPLDVPKCNYLHLELPLYNSNIEWKHFKPMEHIWCFTQTTLETFIRKIGFSIVRLYVPSKLDGELLDEKVGLIAKRIQK